MFSELLHHLYRGGRYGYYWTMSDGTVERTNAKGETYQAHEERTIWFPVDKPPRIPSQQGRNGLIHIYFGINPTVAIPERISKRTNKPKPQQYVRATINDIAAINCLFGDFDDKLLDDIMAFVPAPSVVIQSSNGKYQAYWLLRDPYLLETPEQRTFVNKVQAAWRVFTDSDKQAKDIARVLRVPGTRNVKAKYGPNYPEATFIKADFDLLYDFAELASLCEPFIATGDSVNSSATDGTANTRDIARQKLSYALYRVRTAPDKAKHLTLLQMAKFAGGFIHHGAYTEDEAAQALYDAIETRAADPVQAQKTIADGLSYGMATPLPIETRESDIADTPQTEPATEHTPEPTTPADEPHAADDTEMTDDIGPSVEVPPLPESARLDPALSKQACIWLEDYVAFSEKWAPRAYKGFHRAVGLWLLSTVAARRVRLSMGGERYSSLYISLCARTSLYTKSTVAKVALETLKAAGLGHLLAADDATPQAFIRAMTKKLPGDYLERDDAGKARAERRLAFAAQRGWWYEEFGQKVAAMMKDGGFMADFRGILRRFDDCPNEFEYSSILRGDDIVEQPYLSLLTNLTPADLKPYAGKGAALWGDGFWARFAFVTPPPDEPRPRGRWPVGAMQIPRELWEPLRRWHEDLGIPAVQIDEQTDKNDVVKHVDVQVDTLPITDCLLGPGVFEAFYRYLDGLLDIVADMQIQDFDGNYSRLPEKAMRVAMLAASLENDNRIEMRHWALGQEVAEQWRAELHNLAAALQGDVQESRSSDIEDRIVKIIRRHKKLTVSELRRYIRGVGAEELERSCAALERANVVISSETTQGTKRYSLAIVDIVDSRHRRQTPNLSTMSANNTSDRVYQDNRRQNQEVSTVYPVYDVYDISKEESLNSNSIEDGVYVEEVDEGYQVVDYVNTSRFLVSAHTDPKTAQAAADIYIADKRRKQHFTTPEGY